MAETDAEGRKKEEYYARFRRFVGQTLSGEYREIRGTPGIIDEAKGVDVFELVDKLMTARIEHVKQTVALWEMMRGSLTPSNAGLFYNEIVASLESFLKFEHSNSSELNSWTVPKDRKELPPYLSDTPVLDGMAKQDTGDEEDKLKLLCGDFVTEGLRELFEEVKRAINHRDDENRGDRISNLLAAGRGETSQQVGEESNQHEAASQLSYQQMVTASVPPPEVPAPPQFTQSDFPALPASTPRACRGVGVTFSSTRQPTITGMGGNGRIATTAPASTRSANPNIRPLMSLDVEPPAPSNRSEGSSPTSMLIREFASALSGILQNIGETREGRRRRRVRPLSQRDPTVIHNRDSGLNSSSTQENSTRNETPTTDHDAETPVLTSSTSQADTAEITDHEGTERIGGLAETERTQEVNISSGENLTIQVSNSVLNTTVDNKPNIQPATPRGPSYASIASSRTSSSSIPTSSRIKRNVATNSSRDFPSLSNGSGCSNTTNLPAINEWVEVKSKHVAIPKPLEAAEKPLVTVQPKPAREERQTVLAAVAEAWDNPEEEDPERERERERRRLKNRNQRAAKKQRDKEAKRSRAENASTSQVTPDIGEVAKADEEIASGNEEVAPKNEQIAPENGELAPENHEVAPKNGNVAPENEEVAKAAVEDVVAVPNEIAEGEPISAEVDPLVSGGDPVVADQVAEPVVAVQEGHYDETGRYFDSVTLVEPEGDPLKHKDSHLAELHAEMNEHCKILFRILWFQNHNKIEKVRLDEETRRSFKERLVQCRKMMERIDAFGRLIMYRCGKQNVDKDIEENILQCGKNLLSIRYYDVEENVHFAKQVAFLAGRPSKNHKYQEYIFKILSLGSEFIPMLKESDDRIARYKELVILARLHVARVSKVYQELNALYRFQSVVIPQENKTLRRL